MATLLSVEEMSQSPPAPRELEVPAPTAWPFVLAVGFTLLFAGLVTNPSVSILGAVGMKLLCLSFLRIYGLQPSAGWSNAFRSQPTNCAPGCLFTRIQFLLA
jgi:hypothetical protein